MTELRVWARWRAALATRASNFALRSTMIKYQVLSLMRIRSGITTESNTRAVAICLPWIIPNGGTSILAFEITERLEKLGWRVCIVETEGLPDGYVRQSPIRKSNIEVLGFGSIGERPESWLTSHDVVVNLGSPTLYRLAAKIKWMNPNVVLVDYHFNDRGHFASAHATAAAWDATWLAHSGIRRQPWMRNPQVVFAPVPSVARQGAMRGDDPVGRRAATESPDPRLRVVWIGRLSAEKDPLAFIDLAASCRSSPVEFRMIGQGPLQDKVGQALTGSSGLRYTAKVPDVQQALAESDILVSTSLVEGIPLVVLEALSMGVPVLAPAVGGIPEVISHGRNGWIVPVAEMRHTLNRLAENRPEVEAASSNALATDLSAMTADSVVRRWVSLLEDLLGGPSGSKGSEA